MAREHAATLSRAIAGGLPGCSSSSVLIQLISCRAVILADYLLRIISIRWGADAEDGDGDGYRPFIEAFRRLIFIFMPSYH